MPKLPGASKLSKVNWESGFSKSPTKDIHKYLDQTGLTPAQAQARAVAVRHSNDKARLAKESLERFLAARAAGPSMEPLEEFRRRMSKVDTSHELPGLWDKSSAYNKGMMDKLALSMKPLYPMSRLVAQHLRGAGAVKPGGLKKVLTDIINRKQVLHQAARSNLPLVDIEQGWRSNPGAVQDFKTQADRMAGWLERKMPPVQ